VSLGTVATVLRSSAAWKATAFFGLQSMTFYTVITWLPSIEVAQGTSADAAGWHQLVYQLLGSAAGFGVGFLTGGKHGLRLSAVLVSLPVVVAALGLATFPDLVLLWIMLLAAGAGGALTVALTIIVVSAESGGQVTALSCMAQSFGYLIAAVGPLGGGALASVADWTTVLWAVAAVAGVQLVISLRIGRKNLA
jgi:CP family cyanate transporter-like MFS transporter